jgi:hypothetical protein
MNIFSRSLRSLSQELSQSGRRGSAKSRQARRFALRPHLELLEQRLAPAGNLAITNAILVNSNNQPLSTVNIGEKVFVQADFTTQSLPSNASYRVAYTVNGLTQDTGYLTSGAGLSGTGSWDYYRGTFIATPGTNQVTVKVDPDHSVAETSYTDNTMSFTFNAVSPVVGTLSYTVAQIRAAYGINSIPKFGSAAADGSGQTIALDEAGNDPNILTDLDGFDQAMSLMINAGQTLYQQYGPASSFVTVYNQSGVNITATIATSGSNGVPAEDPTGQWEGEETLDVEWAHAMAPGAKIDIIEVNDDANWPSNLLAGDHLAATLPGVSAVSNSWGLNEWSGETAYDSSTFVTPGGHTGVTFLTASNDNGAKVYPSPPSTPPPSVGNDGYFPATSPNVVSVGGTELTLNNNAYGSETSWSFPAPTSTAGIGSLSYTQNGTWASQAGGFSGSYSTAAGGSSSSATWTLAITPANTGWGTEISATWTANPGNATNATYTIYDGPRSSGRILGTVVIDQTKAPAGTVDGNSQFQELGVFFPTLTKGNGTLTVVLNANSANGTVVADAMGTTQAWASTGGPSRFESEPSYQLAVQNTKYTTLTKAGTVETRIEYHYGPGQLVSAISDNGSDGELALAFETSAPSETDFPVKYTSFAPTGNGGYTTTIISGGVSQTITLEPQAPIAGLPGTPYSGTGQDGTDYTFVVKSDGSISEVIVSPANGPAYTVPVEEVSTEETNPAVNSPTLLEPPNTTPSPPGNASLVFPPIQNSDGTWSVTEQTWTVNNGSVFVSGQTTTTYAVFPSANTPPLNTLIVSYNTMGQATTSIFTDANGNVTTTNNTYGLDGKLTSSKSTGPGGTITTNFDSNGKLISSTETGAFGQTTNTYNQNGDVLTSKATDPNGNPLETYNETYDANGNITTVSFGGANGTTLYTFNPDETIASMKFTDPDGNVFTTVYQYNANGQLATTTTTDDQGNSYTTTYQYDSDGNLIGTPTTGPDGAPADGLLINGLDDSLSLQGEATVESGASLEDHGSVTVEPGGTLADNGTLTVESGASLDNEGAVTVGSGAGFDNVGSVTVQSGGSMTVESGGSLVDPGTMTVESVAVGGSLVDEGTLAIQPGGSLDVSQGSGVFVATGASFDDEGTVTVGGANISVGITVEPGSNFEVQGTLSVELVGFLDDHGTVTVEADGRLDAQGGVVVESGASMDDMGTVTTEGAGGVDNLNDMGTVTVGPNATIDDKRDVLVSPGGSLQDQGVITVETSGNLNDQGLVTVQGGGSLNIIGAVLVVGSLDDLGTTTVGAGGSLEDEGTLDVQGGSFDDQGTVKVENGGSLDDQDAITVASGATLNVYGHLTEGADGELDDFGTLVIEQGATLDIFGTVIIEPGSTYKPLGTVTIKQGGVLKQPMTTPPIVTPPANENSTEGATQQFSLGSFSDPNSGPRNVDVNWGDGTPDTKFTAAAAGSLGMQSHTYGEEGTHTVRITVTNTADNLSDSKTFQVAISDPAVLGTAVKVSAAAGIGFNGAVATFTDPGGAEANDGTHYSASIDWGDKTTPTNGTISFSNGTFTVNGSHTYAAGGSYTVTCTIDHETVLTMVMSSAAVTATQQPPVVTGPADQNAAEGAAQSFDVGSFSDPDGGPWNVDVKWGDGSPDTTFSALAPGALAKQSHTYGEQGSDTVTLKVTDSADGQSDSKTFTITVSDPAVKAVGAFAFAAVEGTLSASRTVATFTDPGGPEPVSDYAATIAWGDSTTSTGTITLSGSVFTVQGSHTYAEQGSDTISVTVHHESAPDSNMVTSTATVSDPAVLAAGVAVSAAEGTAFTGKSVATFTDPGGPEPVSDYSATIVWGDSTSSTGMITLSAGVFTVQGSHTYGEEGPYTITTTINHEGIMTKATSMASVSDPPVVGTAVKVSATAGAPFSGTLSTFTDPGGPEPNSSDPTTGISSDYTAKVNWGDSTPVTTGTITFNSNTGVFSVNGSHVYAAAGPYTITCTINHETVPTVVPNSATVVNLGTSVQSGLAAGIGFWQNKNGQALISSFNGGSTSTALANWLAAALPNLYGTNAGANNLTGKTNAQVAAYYLKLFNEQGPKLDAEVLDTALDLYATTMSLGGTEAQASGFKVNADGLGAYLWSIGSNGTAFGIANNMTLNVYEILLAANNKAVGGVLYGGDQTLRNEAITVFDAINKAGGI